MLLTRHSASSFNLTIKSILLILLILLCYLVYPIVYPPPLLDPSSHFINVDTNIDYYNFNNYINSNSNKQAVHHNEEIHINSNNYIIIIIVKRNNILQLHEFIGSFHLYCIHCKIHIYSYSLLKEQISEILTYKNVHLFNIVEDNVLYVEGAKFIINFPSSCILHSLTYHNLKKDVIYIDLFYILYKNPDFELFNNQFSYFIKSEKQIDCDNNNIVTVNSNIQGYKNSQTSIDFLKLLMSEDACEKYHLCYVENKISIPIDKFPITVYEDASIASLVLTDISNIKTVTTLSTEETCNSDLSDLSVKKIGNPEMEIYGSTNIAYLKFDLHEIKGKITKLELILHLSWVSDANGNPLTRKNVRGVCKIALVRNSNWNVPIKYKTKPFYNPKESISFLWTKENLNGESITIDVSSFSDIIRLISEYSVISLVLFDSFENDFFKFYSRHTSILDKQPVLRVHVLGEGILKNNIQYIDVKKI